MRYIDDNGQVRFGEWAGLECCTITQMKYPLFEIAMAQWMQTGRDHFWRIGADVLQDLKAMRAERGMIPYERAPVETAGNHPHRFMGLPVHTDGELGTVKLYRMVIADYKNSMVQ